MPNHCTLNLSGIWLGKLGLRQASEPRSLRLYENSEATLLENFKHLVLRTEKQDTVQGELATENHSKALPLPRLPSMTRVAATFELVSVCIVVRWAKSCGCPRHNSGKCKLSLRHRTWILSQMNSTARLAKGTC